LLRPRNCVTRRALFPAMSA